MPCYLQLMGETFDPSNAPELSSLNPVHTARVGDPNPGRSGFTEVGSLYGEVSPRARMLDMVEHATAYLVRHQVVLGKLDAVDGLRYRMLAFHVGAKEFAALESRFTLPPTLLRLCAEYKLGISLVVQ